MVRVLVESTQLDKEQPHLHAAGWTIISIQFLSHYFLMVYLFYVHCLVYSLGTTSTCSCKNKIVNGIHSWAMRIKKQHWGIHTGGQTKKTGRKKKVHEKTSTHIRVGYFMYLSFRSMYFFFSHKYMKKYTDFRTSITALRPVIFLNCT